MNLKLWFTFIETSVEGGKNDERRDQMPQFAQFSVISAAEGVDSIELSARCGGQEQPPIYVDGKAALVAVVGFELRAHIDSM
jgi:hypothetical protein